MTITLWKLSLHQLLRISFILAVYFAFVYSLLLQLFILLLPHLCDLFPPLSFHLFLAFLDSEATFNSRDKLTCRLVMSKCIYCINLAFQLVMILPAIWWCKVSSALSPIAMEGLLCPVLFEGHIYPSIVIPCLPLLCLLVLNESIDEAFLV